MRTNNLKFNPNKTKIPLVGSDSALGKWYFAGAWCCCTSLESPGSTSEVAFRSSTTIAVLWLYRPFTVEWQLQPFLVTLQRLVTHALVTTRPNYCNSLNEGLPLNTVHKVQCGLLTGLKSTEYIIPSFKQLTCFWMQFRVPTSCKQARTKLPEGTAAQASSSFNECLLWLPLPLEVKRVKTHERTPLVAASFP